MEAGGGESNGLNEGQPKLLIEWTVGHPKVVDVNMFDSLVPVEFGDLILQII